jgi:hypothetical protein
MNSRLASPLRVLMPAALAALIFATAGLQSARALDFAVDANVGTMGLGVGGVVQITRNLNTRFGFNDYEISKSLDIDDDEGGLVYDGDAKVEMSNQYLLFDWYPSNRSAFRVTLGGYLNGNEMSATATVTENNTQIGDSTAGVGTSATVDLSYSDTAGYAGIGWGNTFRKGFLHFGIDFGVVFQGEPIVGLTVVDSCDPVCTISQEDVDQERQQLEDDNKDTLDQLKIWPLLQVNLGFNF